MELDPLRYSAMTIDQLEREKAAIETELTRRRSSLLSLFHVTVDPTMPPDEVEIISGSGQWLRITNLDPQK